MYAWFWHRLPGPVALRLLLSAVLLGGLVLLLFGVVFPAVDAHLHLNEVTVENP